MNAYLPSLFSGKYLPQRNSHTSTPGGQNWSPVVSWGDVPPGTESLLLMLADTHPSAPGWIHWYVIDIPPMVRGIPERASGFRDKMPPGCSELRNSYGDTGYTGPKLLRGSEPHTYELAVLALSVPSLSVGPYSGPEERAAALEGLVLAKAAATMISAPAV